MPTLHWIHCMFNHLKKIHKIHLYNLHGKRASILIGSFFLFLLISSDFKSFCDISRYLEMKGSGKLAAPLQGNLSAASTASRGCRIVTRLYVDVEYPGNVMLRAVVAYQADIQKYPRFSFFRPLFRFRQKMLVVAALKKSASDTPQQQRRTWAKAYVNTHRNVLLFVFIYS